MARIQIDQEDVQKIVERVSNAIIAELKGQLIRIDSTPPHRKVVDSDRVLSPADKKWGYLFGVDGVVKRRESISRTQLDRQWTSTPMRTRLGVGSWGRKSSFVFDQCESSPSLWSRE